jgi:hypothetical protein
VAVIEAYVEELSGALRGPRRHKADLLTEARDSLVDAAEAYQDRGLDREPAERRAVTEFGAVPEIAPAYQAELAIGQGRRTALLVAAIQATQHFGAEALWRSTTPGIAEWRAPSVYGVIAEVTDIVGLLCIAAALTAAAVFTRGGSPRLVRATGLVTLGSFVFFGVAGAFLTFAGPLATTLSSLGGLILYFVTASVPAVAVGLSAHRCLFMTRTVRATTA